MKKHLCYISAVIILLCLNGVLLGQPTNDSCTAAVEVLLDETVDFTTIDATTDGPFHPNSPCPSSASDSIFSDIWYVHTATITGDLVWSLCGMADFDSRIAVYNAGAMCPLSDDDLLDCNEDGPAACTNFESELKFSVVAGQTYMMRLGGFGSEEPGAQGSGSFTLTEAPAGPPNNDCADAIPVSLGEDQPVSNISATTDGPTHPNDQICFGFGDNTCQNDIWYTFLSPVTGTILWSTCDQVNWDARLVVYGPNVSCAEASPDNMIGCSDATPGCANFTNILYFDVEEGETYLLRIGGYNGATGAGVFDLVEVIPPEPPANDLCENADTAWVMTAAQADDFEFIFEGTIINSTVSDGVVDPSCGGGTGGEYPDVWYKFNSVGNEMIELRYTAQIEGTGFYLEIFENCGGDTLQPESACFSFTPDDTGFKTDTIFGLPPTPTEFYIRVSGSLFWTPGVFFFQPVAEIIVDADEASFPGEAKIYPNPANIALHLDFRLTKSASSEAYILNSLGQVLYHEDLGFLSQGTHHHSFDMNKLPPGIYHLVVKADGAKKVLRFAKQ